MEQTKKSNADKDMNGFWNISIAQGLRIYLAVIHVVNT